MKKKKEEALVPFKRGPVGSLIPAIHLLPHPFSCFFTREAKEPLACAAPITSRAASFSVDNLALFLSSSFLPLRAAMYSAARNKRLASRGLQSPFSAPIPRVSYTQASPWATRWEGKHNLARESQ
jgi:hypothetical protein